MGLRYFKKLAIFGEHHPLVIRSSVRQNIAHSPNRLRIYTLLMEIYLPADPAHIQPIHPEAIRFPNRRNTSTRFMLPLYLLGKK
jgi:hypothetical protein